MSKTHAYNPHPPLLQYALNKPHKLQDPRIIVKTVVFRSADQDCVDGREVGVGLDIDDVENAEGEGGGGEGWCEEREGGVQEGSEDTAVAAVFGDCAGEGGVTFEDCDAEGWGGHGCCVV